MQFGFRQKHLTSQAFPSQETLAVEHLLTFKKPLIQLIIIYLFKN